MSPREVSLRMQKKLYASQDRKGPPSFPALALEASPAFPSLPDKAGAPAELLEALRRDAEEILAGRWKAFGGVPLQVDDPPKWQFDYLVGRDFQSSRSGFDLDHRAQLGGADIKIIWEPSRWNQLVRLAMAAWLLGHERAQAKCIEWLADWCRTNEPFTGLNWTSGLETGIRLVQFTWIDALLSAAGAPAKSMAELRQQILLPHTWYTWRYRSFGSSANNHLLGELAGLITAGARWPDLAKIAAPLEAIGAGFEREVLAQFAADGGNNEQALGYHLFSFEFCWQSMRALQSGGITVSREASERILRAGEFYAATKPEGDVWDFGDSDNAWVTPLFLDESQAGLEWHRWFRGRKESAGLRYWWGAFPGKSRGKKGEWELFPDSGYAVFQNEDWFLRVDASPLGYLSMAPHGHLDALHLSVWYRGRPVIIDPGTGAYYANKRVRDYLATWAAHNGPRLQLKGESYPKRYGTFLWGSHHPLPVIHRISGTALEVELQLPSGKARRRVVFVPADNSISIEDEFLPASQPATVVTHWQFAPGLRLAEASHQQITVTNGELGLSFQPRWVGVKHWNPPAEWDGREVHTLEELPQVPMQAVVSPRFRRLALAPYVVLEAPAQTESLQVILSPV